MANGEPEVSVTVVNPEGNDANGTNDPATVNAANEAAAAAVQAESAANSAGAAASETEQANAAATEAANAAVTGADTATEAAEEAVTAVESLIGAINSLPERIAEALTSAAAKAKETATAPVTPTETGPSQAEITQSDTAPASQHWLMRPVGKRKK